MENDYLLETAKVIPSEELLETSYLKLFRKYGSTIPKIMRCRSEISLAEQSMAFACKIADYTPEQASIETSLMALDHYKCAWNIYLAWNNYLKELGLDMVIEPIGGNDEMIQIGKELYWFLGEQYIENLLECSPIPSSQAQSIFEEAMLCYETSDIQPSYKDEDFELICRTLEESKKTGADFHLPEGILQD